VIIAIVYWTLNHKGEAPVSSWLLAHIELIRNFYKESPVLSIALFCVAHFFSATMSIPGSCTFLNILSGAVFGFWRGVCIVYPITIFSGCVGYFLGTKLPLKFLEKKYKDQIEALKNNLSANGHFYLILARLSPLLPYGVINLVLGFLRIPFFTFVLSTTVGVFFDVALLNSIGDFLSGNPINTMHDKRNIAITFFILFISSYFVKLLKSNWGILKSKMERVKV
jgi:uncharacterized membrane protein YdjX (TVP38/TMEM64 family)